MRKNNKKDIFMYYKKLNNNQRNMKHRRENRNRLVCNLLNDNPNMTSYEALKIINGQLKLNGKKKIV